MGREIIDFYKYIIKRKDGKYGIKYDNEWFGTYDDVRDALHDRDMLVECEWDFTEMNSRDEKPNRYKDMELPPSRRYITLVRQGNREYYNIRKTINGKSVFFGQYKTFKEAAERRDELEKIGWVKETN